MIALQPMRHANVILPLPTLHLDCLLKMRTTRVACLTGNPHHCLTTTSRRLINPTGFNPPGPGGPSRALALVRHSTRRKNLVAGRLDVISHFDTVNVPGPTSNEIPGPRAQAGYLSADQ